MLQNIYVMRRLIGTLVKVLISNTFKIIKFIKKTHNEKTATYIIMDKIPPIYYTTVSNGFIQLRSSQRSGVIQTFGTDIATAIVQGSQIVATSNKGVTYIYSIKNNYAILTKTY